jgi:hypothetical protein
VPFIDLAQKIANELASVAPTHFGKSAVAGNNSHPRYVWVRERIEYGTQKRKQGRPQNFGESAHVCSVHCWAKTESGAERLAQALETVARKFANGPTNYEIRNAEWTEPSFATNGAVLTLELALYMPRMAADYPTTGLVVDPEIAVADLEEVTADVQSVDFDTDGEIDDDDSLVAPDH